jgi:hypothetical protein
MANMKGMNRPIATRLRARLQAKGVPASQHNTEDLVRFFPEALNISAAGMSCEEIAQVLIYLIEKQLIVVPATAGHAVKEVAPGWHVCRFYRDFSEMLKLVAPYIADGLNNGEGCFWILPEAVPTSAACNVLGQFVEDIESRLSSGQLEIIPHRNWYLDDSGQLKSFERIAEALLVKQDQALARGFKFLRAAGDAAWVSGSEESKNFIDYEMKVDAVLGTTKVAAMCTYRATVTADEVVAIVGAHQDALCRAAV